LLLVVEHNAAKPHPKLEHRLGGSNRNNRVSLISKYADVAQNRRRKTITFLTTFLPVLSMFMKSFLEKAERMLRDCCWGGLLVSWVDGWMDGGFDSLLVCWLVGWLIH
ncbi:MAG: hypothetical protein KDI62_22750, partial [Anaerolineae bacterium]|nr:hypothetical protein [Anaerolineae bacterium]